MNRAEFVDAIRSELRHIGTEQESVRVAMGKQIDSDRIAAITYHLQGVYGGIENVLLKFLDQYEVPRPAGQEWHLKLTQLFDGSFGSLPILVPAELLRDLKDLRGFRHVARSNYSSRMHWDKIEPIATALELWLPRWAANVESILDKYTAGDE